MKPLSINKGYEKCGISPFNPDIFTNVNFVTANNKKRTTNPWNLVFQQVQRLQSTITMKPTTVPCQFTVLLHQVRNHPSIALSGLLSYPYNILYHGENLHMYSENLWHVSPLPGVARKQPSRDSLVPQAAKMNAFCRSWIPTYQRI